MTHRASAPLLGLILGLAVTACQQAADEPILSDVDQAATVCASGPTLKGIDVSVYQGTIDWAKVKAGGLAYAFIRVSDGVNSPDSKFVANWAGAKNAGVLRGVYQFFRPSQDPIAQADLMLGKMGTLGGDDLSPVLDVEATDGLAPAAIAAKIKTWVSYVATKTKRVPIIYTGFYFWRDQVGGPTIGTSPLWVAAYGTPCPMVPTPWTKWAFWQYSSTGAVSGIAGNVDMDTFMGTRAQLLATMAAPTVCGDGTCGGDETSASCPADCPSCGVIPVGGGEIDDGDACFDAGGPATYLRAVNGHGADGDLLWTHATSDPTEANFAQWNLDLAKAGRYKVEVYTDHGYAQSKQARYAVRASGAGQTVVVDQSAADGWQTLGEFDFAAGADQWIHLGDNTGEPATANLQLVFDAVRLTNLDGAGGGGVVTDPGGNPAQGDGGGCAAAGGGAGLWMIALALGLRRRRR
jgi:lysozyme